MTEPRRAPRIVPAILACLVIFQAPTTAETASSPIQESVCRHGTMAYLAADSFVGRSLRLYGEWSSGELSSLLPFVAAGDVVLDVGANIGSFSVPLARRVGPEGLVYAFEAQPELCALLSRNRDLNAVPISVQCTALGEERGFATFPDVDYGHVGNFGGISLDPAASAAVARDKVTVPVAPIDALLAELGEARCPTLVKMDVEGMELMVLRGALQLLRRCTPVLYLENGTEDGSPALLGLLEALGYEAYWDVRPYFTKDNFNNVSEDAFGDGHLAINVLATHPHPAGAGAGRAAAGVSGFQRIDYRLPLLSSYLLKFRGASTVLRQHGSRGGRAGAEGWDHG